MPKTLADMTPEQRANCVGMWCDTPKGTFVLLGRFCQELEIFGWQLVAPSGGMKIDYQPGNITPRPDLPRAWAPDGQPPAGKWEHAEYLGDYKGMTNVYHYDGDPTHRRWVGEWEKA